MNSISDKSVSRTKRWFIGYLILSILFFSALFFFDGNEEDQMKEALELAESEVQQLGDTVGMYETVLSTTGHTDLSDLDQLRSDIDQLRNREGLNTVQLDYLNNYSRLLTSVRDSIELVRDYEGDYEENLLALRRENKKMARERDSLEENWREKKMNLQNRLRNIQRKLDNKKEQLEQKENVQVITFESSKGKKVHYLGETENGKANGGGIGIWSTGGMYQGDWKDNERHGEGRYEWSNNHVYEGEFQNDVRVGEGTYYWPSGERYEGEWSNDRRNGKGTLYNKDGNIQYEGQWKNDEVVKS
ncbi:MAG: hypothetical protein ACQERC_04605 [Bacteroidota bacterium]